MIERSIFENIKLELESSIRTCVRINSLLTGESSEA